YVPGPGALFAAGAKAASSCVAEKAVSLEGCANEPPRMTGAVKFWALTNVSNWRFGYAVQRFFCGNGASRSLPGMYICPCVSSICRSAAPQRSHDGSVGTVNRTSYER